MMKRLLVILLSLGMTGLASALVISNSTISGITATSAVVFVQVVSTNGTGTNPVLTCYYDITDHGTNYAINTYTNAYGLAGEGTWAVSNQNLSAATKYYFRWRGVEGTNITLTTPSSNWWTSASLPTAAPPSGAYGNVSAVVTSSVLKWPTNFFAANSNLIIGAIGLSGYLTSETLWIAASNKVVYTNDSRLTDARTPLAHNQDYATITNAPSFLTNETYLGTITGATITAGSADNVTVTGPNAVITWNTNAAVGGGGTVNSVAIDYDEGSTNYAAVTANTNIHISFKTNYSTGAGTITNLLSSDNSIAWTESGGPQPNGSVTAYVAGVVAGYGITGQIVALQGATNALNTRVGNLETSTGALNTAVGNLQAATNALNTRATSLEVATGSLNTAVGNLNTSTNVLNTRVGNLETATGTLNTAVGTLNTSTNAINTAMFRKDGTVPMSADINAGGYAFTNLQSIKLSASDGIVWPAGKFQIVQQNNELGILGLQYGGGTNTPATNIYFGNISSDHYLSIKSTMVESHVPLVASSLQITGGATNGATWIATNTTGQGKWSWPVGFRSIISTNFTFANNTATTIYFDTETYDYGNHFSTTTFVAPVNGIYNFKIYSTWVRTSGACTVVNTRALKNGVEMSRKQSGIIAGTFGTVDLDTGEVYLTNGAAITFTLVGQSATTNYLVAGEGFYVNGTLIRELP